MMWILFVTGFFILFYINRSRNVHYWEKRSVPMASDYNWLFGHFKSLLFNKKNIRSFLTDMYNEYPDAPVVGYLKMSSPELLVRDLDLVKAVLVTDFGHFSRNVFSVDKDADILVAENPFNNYGEEWKTARARVTPVLTYAKLKGYLPSIWKVGDEMVKHINGKCDQRGLAEIECKQLFEKYTTDILGCAICGIENNSFENEDTLFATITKNMFVTNWLDNIKVNVATVFPELGKFLKIRLSSRIVEKLLLKTVREVMSDRSSNEVTRNDLFHVMMTFQDNDKDGVITDKYVASQIFTIMIDLYETSSTVMAFTLFELAWQSEIQEKLRKEILDYKSQINREITIDDVESLTYLDMVLSESLRLYPPLTFLNKICTADYNMQIQENKTLTIQKGTVVMIPILGIHHDPKYYPNPEKYDPERFSADAIASRHKFAFLPFNEGPRVCIGRRIATLNIKLAIIKIMENFRLKPCVKSNYPLDFDFSAILFPRPLNGAWVYFEKLQK